MKGNVIVGQSGGPTCVINSTLAGVFKASKDLGVGKVFGMLHGIKGFLNDEYVDLDDKLPYNIDIDLLKRTPASYLGSCRFKLPEISADEEIYVKIFEKLKVLEISYFFYIGGNDSMDTIKKLSDYGKKINSPIRFMGVPKTIDNDLAMTDHTPGFGSAAKYIATTLKELVCDCRIYDCPAVTIVEIMGRNAGWLTASAALVCGEDSEGVDLIFLPEKPFDVDFFMRRVKEVVENKKYCVVALSEGIKLSDGRFVCELGADGAAVDAFGHKMMSGSAKYLENLIKSTMNIKARAIEISTLQRCASHFASLTDIEEAFDCGATAVNAAMFDLETGKVVCMKRVSNVPYKVTYELADVHNIANVEKTVPLDWITEDYVTVGDVALALMAKYMLKERKGKVVTPVSTSSLVEKIVKDNGGEIVYTAVGSPIVAKKMREENAVFGGEESGGMIFPKFQYCRDPALAIAKMLECIIENGPIDEQIAKLPVYHMEKRDIICPEDKKEPLLNHLIENCSDGNIETMDGLKVFFDDGWVIARPSGTEDKFRIFSESTDYDVAVARAEEFERETLVFLSSF